MAVARPPRPAPEIMMLRGLQVCDGGDLDGVGSGVGGGGGIGSEGRRLRKFRELDG